MIAERGDGKIVAMDYHHIPDIVRIRAQGRPDGFLTLVGNDLLALVYREAEYRRHWT